MDIYQEQNIFPKDRRASMGTYVRKNLLSFSHIDDKQIGNILPTDVLRKYVKQGLFPKKIYMNKSGTRSSYKKWEDCILGIWNGFYAQLNN